MFSDEIMNLASFKLIPVIFWLSWMFSCKIMNAASFKFIPVIFELSWIFSDKIILIIFWYTYESCQIFCTKPVGIYNTSKSINQIGPKLPIYPGKSVHAIWNSAKTCTPNRMVGIYNTCKAQIKFRQNYPSIEKNLYTLHEIPPKLAHQTGMP